MSSSRNIQCIIAFTPTTHNTIEEGLGRLMLGRASYNTMFNIDSRGTSSSIGNITSSMLLTNFSNSDFEGLCSNGIHCTLYTTFATELLLRITESNESRIAIFLQIAVFYLVIV